MPRGLKRIYGRGDLHFITFSCYRRMPLLGSARARNVFVQVLDRVRNEYAFKLVGYVVMPEHVHLLMTEPARGTPSTVLKMLKQRSSHELRMNWEHRVKAPRSQTERRAPSEPHVVAMRESGVLGKDSGNERHLKSQEGVNAHLFAERGAMLPQFWQRRFFDFNVWSRKKKIEKLAYMHANPLKRGLVNDAKQWPWSSYAFYQRTGEVLIRVDPVE